MEKYELEDGLKEEIRARVLGDGFMKLVQTVRRNGRQFKIAMRPVEIGGVKKYQAEMTDDRDVQVKNLDANGAAEGLEEIIAQKGARDLHLMTAKGDVHIRVTKKGHVLVSRSAEMDRVALVKPHDRVKNVPLAQFDSTMLLKVIGLADGEGRIRASMRGKYDQVNEFLKVVGETVSHQPPATSHQPPATNHQPPATNHQPPFTIVDCGCGKAYLTISLYYYLTEILKFPAVHVIGIDRRADVIASARKMSAKLDLDGKVDFIEADLSTFELLNTSTPHIDMVVSLHACDTATDEAMAKGVEWKARYILSAPCCQHELNKAITVNSSQAFSGLLRQSILRERMCDILTDAFRAMILRILGFKVQVIEFVSSEATTRNIMLKCEYGVKPGQAGPIAEYLDLREYWKVTPWLETRLSSLLGKYLSRYE